MKKSLFIIATVATLFSGCSTDFDVIAPYKEIMVVDGLLNAIDSIQYVKISKAFLGEGNAYVMAQQKDSVNYADVLDVKMDRILHGQLIETFALNRTELNDKDSGIFHYPFHVLYSTNHQIIQGDGSEYKIRVTNSQTNVTASSQTRIVQDIVLRYPLPQIPSIPSRDTVDLASAWIAPFYVIFTPGDNSKIYDLVIRFHYRDIDPSGNSAEQSFDWNFPDVSSGVLQNEIKFQFYKSALFNVIADNIPDKPGYVRRTDSLSGNKRTFEFIISEGTEDLQTYYQLQQPSTGVVQELPTFTTVDNGLGIFTSRIVHSTSYFPSGLTADSLQNSLATRSKNFRF